MLSLVPSPARLLLHTSLQPPTRNHGRFKVRCHSPSYAKAVFDADVFGPIVEGTMTMRSSRKAALDTIMGTLRHYHFAPMLITNKTSLTKIRKTHDSYSTGHSSWCAKGRVYIYCERCYRDNPCPLTFACSVISVVNFVKTTKGRAHATVSAIIPHCSQCDMPLIWRRNHKLDKENAGRAGRNSHFPSKRFFAAPMQRSIS